MQDREIRDQDKIIVEFHTELYDSEQSTIIHTDPKEVPVIMGSGSSTTKYDEWGSNRQ